MLFVFLLVNHIACGFVVLLVLSVCHISNDVVGLCSLDNNSMSYWSYCWFIALLILLLVRHIVSVRHVANVVNLTHC
jgi:hypothetical protein